MLLAATVAGVAVALFRMLAMAGFSNDHFVNLTRSAQMLLGDWPVRDFVDPGLPLMYAVSAVAQAIGGRTLLTEAWLVAAAFGVSAGLTVWLIRQWCGSLALGVWAACAQCVVFTRSYSYPKILLYVVACGVFIAYARRPSKAGLFGLALLSSTAFLLRHDHGLFVGAAACVLVFVTHRAAGVAPAVRAALSYVALTVALLLPYLVYVQVNGGLIPYFQAGVEFSRIEAARTRLRWPLMGSGPIWSSEGLSAIGFGVLWAIPFATLLVLRARRRTASVSERGVVLAIATLGVCVNAGFLRDPLTTRVPDAVVPAVFLGAWLARQAWHAAGDAFGWGTAGRALTATVLVTIVIAAAEIGGFAEQVNRASIAEGVGRMRERWVSVTDQLRAPYAERQMPTDLAFALVPFYEYVQACTRPTDRMLIVGFAPEIPYYARRGFAGGHVHLFSTYHSSDADQRTTLERLQRQSVPFVVMRPGGAQAFAHDFALLDAYVGGQYALMADIHVDGLDEPARIYVHKALAGAPRHPATGWPCVVEVSASRPRES